MGAVLLHVRQGLLWVFAAIGVIALAGFGYFAFTPVHENTQAQKQLRSNAELERALELFRINHGAYPSSIQGLGVLAGKPASGKLPPGFPPKGYLVRGSELTDVWGNAVHYESPGQHRPSYDLASWGADGKPGGAGADADIANWGAEDST